MVKKKTPFDELCKANDAYHTAFGGVMEDKDVPVDLKAKVGSSAETVFQRMLTIKNVLAEHYGKQEVSDG